MLSIGAYAQRLPRPDESLPGRSEPMPLRNAHLVLGRPLRGPFPGLACAQFGMGCFWGAERLYWTLPGVHTTAVGYAGGHTPNPTYREVCSGRTGHAEMVLVVYDPSAIEYARLLQVFWEGHDPTQGMRQGNDRGTQYRSAIHCHDAGQLELVRASAQAYGQRLTAAGQGAISTEIVHPAPPFYYAEQEHQQYLARHPGGYCGLGGTGVSCPVGWAPAGETDR
ncbi:MAG TPA: peptide-methionine (S)-S-oxide reductase MsrA [Xanthomonadaceae bacterium]|nr:peptide-methionine (S)-S-oxide reductase MsrA [Xanthomonadaceae bacterium]